MQGRRRSWYAVRAWTSCRVQASFHAPSVALEWAATASSATATSTGCTRNAVGSSTWQRTLTTDVQGARELHAPWMADHRAVQVRPDKLEVVASFCYLGDRWMWTFNHNMCENHLEEVQGAATSFLFTPPLFQDMWPCVQLLCAECSAPCQWDLAIDKTKPPTPAAEWQGNNQTDLQCHATRRQTRSNELLARLGIEDLVLILKERRLRWYALMVQSRQPFTYRLRDS